VGVVNDGESSGALSASASNTASPDTAFALPLIMVFSTVPEPVPAGPVAPVAPVAPAGPTGPLNEMVKAVPSTTVRLYSELAI
jgi:hypothetical protein